MTPNSVYPALEPLLPRVAKPAQYIGGERNGTVKDWDAATVRWALLYPDAYEVGLSNQGLMILYEILNEQPDVLSERSYAVWPDLEALMRQHGIPQFTVEAHRPVGAFDLLGVSFATELGYTNLLTALDLAGIPLHASDRTDGQPLVIAGGHAAFNPEPIADFLDAAVLGDGEQAVLEITDVIRRAKADDTPRDELLARLARVEGVYVPRFYEVDYLPDGRIHRVAPTRPGVPARVFKRTTTNLDDWPYPKRPLVPLAETVHERMSVEIFRGCTRGCRFCQAGMITRPVRERSLAGIGEMVQRGLAASGFTEVGLLSLSSADHSEIAEITKELADRYQGTNTSLSLPSTRVDAFNVDLAEEISRNGRRSGLTFAPEGGTERVRRVINKMVSEEDLIATVSIAYAHGWRQVKLYFMCGLPTETDEDVVAIAGMARRVIRAGRQASGRGDIRCTISIGAFIPKPHTPFQWAAQCDPETVDGRLRKLRAAVNEEGRTSRHIGMRYHDGRPSLIEGLLSRGDRRVGRVIERVWREGGRFDGWREHFSYQRWVDACTAELEPCGVNLAWFTTRERDRTEVLPWDHLDSGLDKDWLWADWQDALDEREQDDCRWTPCFDCGVCPTLGTRIEVGPSDTRLLPLTPVSGSGPVPNPALTRGAAVVSSSARLSRGAAANPAPPAVQKLRVRYAKRGRARWTSHRDIARTFEWALRRAGAPVALSQGFSPHPRLSWVGAVPTGAASEAEYLEVGLVQQVDPDVFARALDAALPGGLEVVEAVVAGPGSLSERIDTSRWRIELPGVEADELRAAVARLRSVGAVTVDRLTRDGRRQVDARAALVELRVEDRAADGRGCETMTAVVRHSTPAVRPDDVLGALRVVADLEPPVPAKVTRMAQGRLDDDGGLTDPLAADRSRTGDGQPVAGPAPGADRTVQG